MPSAWLPVVLVVSCRVYPTTHELYVESKVYGTVMKVSQGPKAAAAVHIYIRATYSYSYRKCSSRLRTYYLLQRVEYVYHYTYQVLLHSQYAYAKYTSL